MMPQTRTVAPPRDTRKLHPMARPRRLPPWQALAVLLALAALGWAAIIGLAWLVSPG